MTGRKVVCEGTLMKQRKKSFLYFVTLLCVAGWGLSGAHQTEARLTGSSAQDGVDGDGVVAESQVLPQKPVHTRSIEVTRTKTSRVSGYVETNSGFPVANTAIFLKGSVLAAAMTNSDGYYSFSSVPKGSFVMEIPSKAGLRVAKDFRNVAVRGKDMVHDVVAQCSRGFVFEHGECVLDVRALTHTVKGKVTLKGSGVSGVVLNVNGVPGAVTTPSGEFVIPRLAKGDYTLTLEETKKQKGMKQVALKLNLKKSITGFDVNLECKRGFVPLKSGRSATRCVDESQGVSAAIAQ